MTNTTNSELLSIIDELVTDVGRSVTDNYKLKNGLWEGMSLEIANRRLLAVSDLEALIASKVREARLDELSMLERAVERMSWGQYVEARKSSLATLQSREQDKV